MDGVFMEEIRKKRRGREETVSPETARLICEEISSRSDGITKICKEFGVSRQAFFGFLLRHKEFTDIYARAREAQMELMAAQIIEIAEENPKIVIPGKNGEYVATDGAGVQRNRVRIDTLKWLMSKLAPKKYGDRQQVELSGSVDLAGRLDAANKRIE